MDYKAIGRPMRILDGEEKVSGRLRYAPDLKLPGLQHGRFLLSPHAHAKILSIDVSAALEVEGVTAVLTAEDLPDIPPKTRNNLMLARDRVIFAGQPVALVVAENLAAAEDAIDLIWVEYEPLPAAITLAQALADDAPLVWPSGSPGDSGEAGAHGADVGGDGKDESKPSNVAGTAQFNWGDVTQGFANADVIVERSFTTSMVHQSYMETQAVIAQPDPMGQGMTIWTSTQTPFGVREAVSKILGCPETAVRVVPTVPGGAFGAKFVLYEPFVALAAQTLNLPIRLVLTRNEDMLAANPAPSSQFTVKLGAKQDGTFTALDADVIFDAGCYPSPHGIAAFMLGSYYQLPHADIRYQEVMTNKVSTGAFRAPGAPQATYAIESVIDEMAQKLEMDPFALRLQNASVEGDPMAHRKPWPNIGMKQVLEALQAHPAWQNREEARQQGRGVGIAVGGWPGGVEPTAASCQLHRDGTLHVHIGSVDLTGTPAGFALIAAETFGIDPEHVKVIAGDTSTAPFAGATGGSKITFMVGPSIIKAAEDAKQQVQEIAADILEADAADIEVVNGRVQVKGVPDKAIELSEIAQKTMHFGAQYAPVIGNGRHANTQSAPGFCAQLAEVSVDEETGQTIVHRLVLAQDVGRAINPLTLEGQIVGGAMQGLGWALHEGMVFDEEYGTPLTGSLMDYTVPHFVHAAPEIDVVFVENPFELGPFGARGAGEPPIIATAAAVANAIQDASNIRVTDLPMTAPRVLAARD